MPIDPAAVGRSTHPVIHTWTPRDSLLYALAIGAGAGDLAFTTENSIGMTQQAYPTQCVVVGPVTPR